MVLSQVLRVGHLYKVAARDSAEALVSRLGMSVSQLVDLNSDLLLTPTLFEGQVRNPQREREEEEFSCTQSQSMGEEGNSRRDQSPAAPKLQPPIRQPPSQALRHSVLDSLCARIQLSTCAECTIGCMHVYRLR